MLTQTLPLSSFFLVAERTGEDITPKLHLPNVYRSQNDPDSHPAVKTPNYIRDVRTAFKNLEVETKLGEGFSSIASSGRISPAAHKMKQLIDAKSEYENSSDALLSWTAILRLRDFLEKTINNRLHQAESAKTPQGSRLSTFAKAQFQACIALVEEELMRILPATMNTVETQKVKNVFSAVLQFESALLDSAYARNQPYGELQSSSPWHPANIIFTTDFDVTCTVVDSCDSLVRAAESAARKSSGAFRLGQLLEKYNAALARHAIRTRITLQGLEKGDEATVDVTKRLSGRNEASADVVPGMDPLLKASVDDLLKASPISPKQDTEGVAFDDAGLRKALSKMSDLEILCNKDVMTSGVLNGFTKEELVAEAKLVELRADCSRVLKHLVDLGTPINVVSANWSRDLIIAGLPDLPEGKLFVHCNDVSYDASGVSTGTINNTVVDAFDKEQMLRALRVLYSQKEGTNRDSESVAESQADEKAGKMMVYMGDSHTDLLGLLEADLGIVIGASSAALKVMSLYGIKLLPLSEASAQISLSRLNGSPSSWRRSGTLFQVQGWEDVESCLFGGVSLSSSTDPAQPADQSSNDKERPQEISVQQQQQPFSDTADKSQERLPSANLEVVPVAC